LADGSRASDGYQALAELDNNHDGTITSADAGFADLRVWVDANSDGVSGGGEVKTLGELGITQLSVQTTVGATMNNGNLLGLTSSYQTADGASHDAADVWFAVQKSPVSAAVATTSVSVSPLDLGANVSGLAQAIGSFDDTNAPVTAAKSALAGEGAIAATSTVALAGLVDAMRQFDANGKPLDQTVAGLYPQQSAGLVSAQAAQLASVDTRTKDDLLSSSNMSAFTVPK
jgi:hypothetical protein